MPKVIEVPNLGTVEFPDDTPDEAISSSITDHLDRVGKKAALGEEMAATRRERFAGDVGEKAIKGAEFFTQGVSKMFPTSAIGGVMDALGVQPPIPAEHVRQAREFLSWLPARAEIPANVPTVGPTFDPGVEKGVNQFVDELISGLTRPDQAMAIAASGKFPTEVARTFQLAPVVEAPQQIQQIQQASEAGDVPGTAKGIAGLTAGALLPSAIEAGINKPTPIERAGPNARKNALATTLYGDVQPLAQPAEVVPTKEGVRGIQSETSGGIPATQESAQPARPREENQVPLNEQTPPTEANAPASVPSTETAGVSETAGGKSSEAKAPVTKSLKVGEAPTPADIHAATHEEFMAYHDAMKAPGEQRAAVNEFAKSLDENGIKEAERLAQVSRDKAKEIIGGDGPLEARFKQSMEENQRTQFLAEGARTAKAMKAVEEGSTPAEAAKNLGVPVSALEPAKAPEPVKPVEVAKPTEAIGGGEIMGQSQWEDAHGKPVPEFKSKGIRTNNGRPISSTRSNNAQTKKIFGVHAENRTGWQNYVEGELQKGKPVRDEFLRSWANSVGLERAQPMLEKYGYEKAKNGKWMLPGSLLETDAVLKPKTPTTALESSPIVKPAPGKPIAKPKSAEAKPASKQAELTFEEQKAEQAALGESHGTEPEPPPETIGEKYLKQSGVKAAQNSIRILNKRIWEQVAKGNTEFADKFKQEAEQLRKALTDNGYASPPVMESEKLPKWGNGKVGFGSPAEGKVFLFFRGIGNDLHIFENQIAAEAYKIARAEKDPNRQAEFIERVGKPNETIAKAFEDAAKHFKTDPTKFNPVYHPEKPSGSILEIDKPNPFTSATEDESGRLYLNPIGPLIRTTLSDIRDFSHGVKKSAEWIIEKGREAAGLTKEAAKEGFNVGGKMSDYRRSVLNWSMKLQKSFGEAAHAQRDIQKRVPDSIRREAITNWIQADGDNTVLANRAATTTDKRLKKGYEIAQHLTPDEIAIAKQIKGVYDALGQRGQAYGVINNFKENYVTQIWNLKNRLGGSARTLKDKFKYAKARTFDSFYDGEQAGYDPKTKDISKLLPSYLHEMNSVIAARQLVKQMQNGVAADGRPLLVPRGTGTPVSGPSGDATLITPKAVKGDTSDYKLLPNQPALNDWVWAAKDQAGNNIFLKADLMVHPKVYDKLKNTLGRSAIQEWYKSDTGALAMAPKRAVELIDRANSETKRTMLGLITPFHQVQEGTHAIGHRVDPSPWRIPSIDLVGKPEQADAAKHGLMLLPDRASESQFMDGFKTTGLLSHVPGLGRATDAYSRYLFHDYIPGLKMKTYDAILERNKSVFAKDLASGAVSIEDVKVTSAEQTNAAYGHLNYADLGRNPTISHIARALLLAPDFFEARARFAGQAVKGAVGGKVGREQILALGFLALAQATGAYTFAKLSGGEWDKKHPFEFTRHGKRYTMRSVPEDISSLIKDPRMYFNNRMSPAASTADQLRTGLDWKGDRISAGDTLKEAAQKPIPLSVRAMLKMGSKNLTALEQLAGSIGLKISSANPKMEKGIEIKDRTELLANKLRKLNRVERYKSAKDELKDLPPKDRNTVIDKLRRQGVFTYQ